jgi:hypothetical protein
MLKVLNESNGNRLAMRATDLLRDEDYEQTLIPKVESLLKEHGKLRFLLDCDEEFRGWAPVALWDDAKFGLKHSNDFEKIALVGAPLLAEWGARLANHLMDAEIETFETGEFEKAWHWLNQ